VEVCSFVAGVVQTLYTWRVAWNTLHVSNFAEFFDFCSSFSFS
jgi:hypothetical protein